MAGPWIDKLLGAPTTRAVELSAKFAEQRQKLLAENVANIDTPDYHQQQLDPKQFQKSLAEALQRAKSTPGGRIDLQGDSQARLDERGELVVEPVEEPAPNVLFHDGTNARLESLMTDVQQNALSYTMALNLLRARYSDLLTAIRGTVR